MQTSPRRSLGEGGFVNGIDDFFAGKHRNPFAELPFFYRSSDTHSNCIEVRDGDAASPDHRGGRSSIH
jgi:hypothetical protein